MEQHRHFVKTEHGVYQFDTDQNGFPTFTQKNIDFVTAMIGYDSNYSASINENDPQHNDTYVTIFKQFDFSTLQRLEAAIESIDKINSTHLSSEGKRTGSDGTGKRNGGRAITAARIRKIGGDNLRQRLKEGDATLVHEIASAVENRYNFSFASKFCAYASHHALALHNYCIYDRVLQSILPYYYFIYVDGDGYKALYRTKRNATNESIIGELCQDREITDGYTKYRQIVDDIICGIKEKCGIEVNYEDFDHLVWYYFKGSNMKVLKAMNVLPKK